MHTAPEFQDLIELVKGSHYTIILDENLRALKRGLEDNGYKVIVPHSHASDDDIKELAKSGWTILTNNSNDFIDDAPHFDYDVIAVENIKFIDKKPDRSNQTVVKIANAIRRSQLATRKGNFLLTIQDDGSFHLRQLTWLAAPGPNFTAARTPQ